MTRLFLLGGLLAVFSLSLAAAPQPPPAAAAAGPKVIDIVKLKDNLYVLTCSSPGYCGTPCMGLSTASVGWRGS